MKLYIKKLRITVTISNIKYINVTNFFQGDSGGPLIVQDEGRWTLAGITSAGFGCAVDHQPGIYHKVQFTSDWIRSVIKSNT